MEGESNPEKAEKYYRNFGPVLDCVVPTIRFCVRGRQSLRDAGTQEKGNKMVTVSWGQGLSEDGRETFDSVREARALLERDSDLSPEELDRLFETDKFVDENNGSWIMVE